MRGATAITIQTAENRGNQRNNKPGTAENIWRFRRKKKSMIDILKAKGQREK